MLSAPARPGSRSASASRRYRSCCPNRARSKRPRPRPKRASRPFFVQLALEKRLQTLALAAAPAHGQQGRCGDGCELARRWTPFVTIEGRHRTAPWEGLSGPGSLAGEVARCRGASNAVVGPSRASMADRIGPRGFFPPLVASLFAIRAAVVKGPIPNGGVSAVGAAKQGGGFARYAPGADTEEEIRCLAGPHDPGRDRPRLAALALATTST
jgi:hypothetical protein